MSDDLARRITRMYETYAPEKLSRVPTFLAANAGREEEVLEKLIEKYGPEPQTVAVSSSSAVVQPNPVPSPAPAGGSVTAPASLPPAPASTTAAAVPATPISTMAPPSNPVASPPFFASPVSTVVDPMQDLRNQVKSDCGFLTREHELMWEDAWMGRMPLGTLRKTWDLNRSVLLAGLGNKMSSHARPVKRWQKRYFVLAPPFLYYFDADQPNAICKGALYLDRATITDEPLNGVRAITILSRVTKKPLQLDRRGDYSTFVIGFDTEKQHSTWLTMLRQVSLIGDVGSAAKSFGAYPMSGSSMLNAMMSNPMGSSLSGGGVDQAHAAMAAVSLLSNATQPMQAPPGMTQIEFQKQQMNQLNAMGVTPQLVAAAAAQNAPLGSPLRGHPAHPLFNNYSVDAPEIKRRIERLARDRDPVLLAEVFLQFVHNHVESAPLLWKLMASMEEIEPLTGPTYTQAQLHLNNMNGYGLGGGYGAGVLPQQALNAVHKHLFGSQSSDYDTGRTNASQQLLLQEQQRQSFGANSYSLVPAGFTTQLDAGSGGVDMSDINARMLNEHMQRAEPSSAVLRAAASRPPLPQQPPYLGANASARFDSPTRSSGLNFSANGEDGDWQRRIGRIRDRRHLVDRLMKDLPPQ